MMNSPEGFKKENENKSLEELVTLRIKLFNEIVEYEQKHIMDNQPYTNEEVAKPSASDIYNMNNEYLKVITDLIWEKKTGRKFNSLDYSNDEEYIKELEQFEIKLFNPASIFIEMHRGAVLPKTHPNYYNNRIDISITKNNSYYGNAQIEKDEYQLDSNVFESVEKLIIDNFEKLLNISLKQSVESYVGVSHSIRVKVGYILLEISPVNINNEDDKLFVDNFENQIIELIKQSSGKELNDLSQIAESISCEIEKLDNHSEFSYLTFMNNYDLTEKEKFELCELIYSYSRLKNIDIIEKYPEADMGLPYNIPRIKISRFENKGGE